MRCFFCGQLVEPWALLEHGEVCPALKENEKGRRRATSGPSKPEVPPEEQPFFGKGLDELIGKEMEYQTKPTEPVEGAADALTSNTHLNPMMADILDAMRYAFGEKKPKKHFKAAHMRGIEDVAPAARKVLDELVDKMEKESIRVPPFNVVLADLRIVLRHRGISWMEDEMMDGTIQFTYINGC